MDCARRDHITIEHFYLIHNTGQRIAFLHDSARSPSLAARGFPVPQQPHHRLSQRRGIIRLHQGADAAVFKHPRGPSAPADRDDRARAGHRFQQREAEPLLLCRQKDEHVHQRERHARFRQRPRKVDGAPQAACADEGFQRRSLRAVSDDEQVGLGQGRPDLDETAHEMIHPFRWHEAGDGPHDRTAARYADLLAQPLLRRRIRGRLKRGGVNAVRDQMHTLGWHVEVLHEMSTDRLPYWPGPFLQTWPTRVCAWSTSTGSCWSCRVSVRLAANTCGLNSTLVDSGARQWVPPRALTRSSSCPPPEATMMRCPRWANVFESERT